VLRDGLNYATQLRQMWNGTLGPQSNEDKLTIVYEAEWNWERLFGFSWIWLIFIKAPAVEHYSCGLLL
jgi:hypothetical protein